jgi:hypothetical protein
MPGERPLRKVRGQAIHALAILCGTISLTFSLTACGPQGSPQGAVESYFEAVVAKDPIRAAASACDAWEAQARAEARSFETVQVGLEGMSCKISERRDGEAVVSCRGQILADYGGERRNLDLGSRRYFVVVEAGEWRICGYRE